ncbi:hypothetical protein COCON_G00101470 [Conger conger]|uniref:Peroxisome proliferator-activated receptor gamma coactivator 1-alpha n=1 Tax=Conger conger TaxID=82655 RepID=A0A9Q1HYJ6_CONCO|nr:hypothetical protein COCON_G00101470 [Conger conger]
MCRLQKIEEESEASLLAVLTETLDSFPVDEDGLPSFETLTDSGGANGEERTCPSPTATPDCPAPAAESEESLLKKLLLAPANAQLSYDPRAPAKSQNHAGANPRARPPPAVAKWEAPWSGKQPRAVRRPCAELLKYLTSSEDAPHQTKAQRSCKASSSSSSSSSPSSSSSSSYSSLSSSSSSSASGSSSSCKKKPSPSPQQQQQHQRGEAPPPAAASGCRGDGPRRRRGGVCPCGRRAGPAGGGLGPNPRAQRTAAGVSASETPGRVTVTMRKREEPGYASGSSLITRPEPASGPGLPGPAQHAPPRRGLSPGPSAPPRGPPGPGAGRGRGRSGDQVRPVGGGVDDDVTGPLPSACVISVGDPDPAKPASLPLPLTPESSTDHKDSPFENKTIERALSVELSGTPGLTPPTTPPHKASQESPFKATKASSPPPAYQRAGSPSPANHRAGGAEPGGMRKDPQRSELYAQLSRGSATPPRGKRPILRLFGDHDYCQASGAGKRAPPAGPLPAACAKPSSSSSSSSSSWQRADGSAGDPKLPSQSGIPPGAPAGARKPLRDQEIRAELNRHFGSPRLALCGPEAEATAPPGGPEDWGSGEEGFPAGSRGGCRPSSRNRCHGDSSASRSRTQRSPDTWARSQSGSPSTRRPRYDSYEEYQQECMQREEHRRSYEQREYERAEQRDRQRHKAIEERRVVYIGRLGSDITRTELKRQFEVFGDSRDNFGFLTFRYTCDALAALENGHTLRRSTEPRFQLCFGGRKQFCRSTYTDLDSHSDDFDPTSIKSKYDCLDFDSLLREAQRR